MSTHRKRISLALAAILVAAGVGATVAHHEIASGFPFGTAHAATKPVANAPEVDVATVVSATITEYQAYSGRLAAIEHVDIRPLVSGMIVAVHFRDGALVKKGDALFTIDRRPYQAEVDRAAAQLASAQARDGYAASDAARADRLLADNAIAKRDFDEAKNAAREAAAGVTAAQAALEAARINLGYTAIVAPVSGRVSRAEMTVGNIVSAGASAPLLTTLVSVSPMYAEFDVDEQTYLQYLSHDANASVPVELGLANETGFSRKGLVDSVDNRLDTSSGTIRVRARFDNADAALVPGMYARVKVGGGTPHAAVMIDDAAIGTDQDKKFVLVVDKDNRLQYREVQLGAMHDSLRVVASGLQPGERIVVNGLQRVKADDVVSVNSVSMAGDPDHRSPPSQAQVQSTPHAAKRAS